MTTVLGILILVCALFLIISVLLQSSKNHRMSGVVSGAADTFFGKQKGKTIDAKLSKATAIISVIFCALILVLYFITAKASQPVVNEGDVQTPVVDLNEGGIITDEIEVVEGEENAEVVPEAENENTTTEEAPVENAEVAENAEEAPAENAEAVEGTPAETEPEANTVAE